MKNLIVLRHATAEKSGPDGSDLTRPLAPEGRREALAQGLRLLREDRIPQGVLTSVAVRAMETTQELCAALKEPPPVWALEHLYNASGYELLTALRETPENPDTLLLVAHMPGVAELVYLLLPPGRAPTLNFVPGALAALTVDIAHWKDIAPGRGQFGDLHLPEL